MYTYAQTHAKHMLNAAPLLAAAARKPKCLHMKLQCSQGVVAVCYAVDCETAQLVTLTNQSHHSSAGSPTGFCLWVFLFYM